MDRNKEKQYDQAVEYMEWSKDRINDLEEENEKLSDACTEYISKINELQDEIKDLENELSKYDIRDKNTD